MFSLAKLIVPESNETKEIDVAQTWEVRWQGAPFSRDWCPQPVPHMEVFTSQAEADGFAQSIRNAWQLARVTGLSVSVTKRPPIR